MEEDFKTFMINTHKARGKKGHLKVRNSWGVYDAYKHIRKNKWYDIGRPLKEHEFYNVIRGINKLLAEELGRGNRVVFPHKMGILELRKQQAGSYYKDGKLKIHHVVDWNSTLKLWFQDPEARRDKILIRFAANTIYHIHYCRSMAVYNNKIYYEFIVNRNIKRALKENINAGKADTLYEG